MGDDLADHRSAVRQSSATWDRAYRTTFDDDPVIFATWRRDQLGDWSSTFRNRCAVELHHRHGMLAKTLCVDRLVD